MTDLDKYVQKTDHDVTNFLSTIKNRVAQILPAAIGSGRVLQTMAHSIRMNPQLMQCTRDSLLAALLQSAREGLEIGTECHLIPRKNKGRLQVVYQRDFRGELTLARRSGEYASINADIAYTNDTIEAIQGTENDFTVKPNLIDRGDVFLFWAAYSLKDGGKGFGYMNVEQMTEHMVKYAPKNQQGAVVGPWVDHFEAMALKTIIRRVLKYAPKAYEQHSLVADGQVLTLDSPGLGEMPAPAAEQPEELEVYEPSDDGSQAGPPEEKKKKRGRPKGAKNKPKPEPEEKRPEPSKEETGPPPSDVDIVVGDYKKTIDQYSDSGEIRQWIRDFGPAILVPEMGEKEALALHQYALSAIAKLEDKKK